MAPVVEQGGRTRGLGHVAGQAADITGMVGVGVHRVVALVLPGGGLRLGIGVELEQALVDHELLVDLATLLLQARIDHVFHVLDRGIALVDPGRIVVADLHHRIAIPLLSCGHALVDRLHPGLIAPGQRQGVGGRQQQGKRDGERRPAGENNGNDGHGLQWSTKQLAG